MTYCRTCLKYPNRIIYALYGVLVVYGIGLFAWGLADKYGAKDNKTAMTYGMWMGVGLMSILNACMGIYGTYNGDKCLVYASIVVLFTSCIVQVLVTIVRITLPTKGSAAQKADLENLFEKEDEDYVDQFNKIEEELQCCGVMKYDDYEKKFDPLLIGYPGSCCPDAVKPCRQPFDVGCHQKVMEAIKHEELLRAIMFITSAVIKYISALVISVLTIWGDQLLT